MAGYQKTIAYLDYLENGMKIKNAGFVRIEESGGRMRLEMRVKNIPEDVSGQYELKADAGGTVGRISFSRGCGSCCVVWTQGNEAPQGKRKVQANGVYIRLTGRRLVQTVWPTPIMLLTEEEPQSPKKACPQAESAPPEGFRPQAEIAPPEGSRPQVESAPREEARPQAEIAPPEAPRPQAADVPGEDAGLRAESLPEEAPCPQEERRDDSEAEIKTELPLPKDSIREVKEPVCYSDKWEQLSHMYMQIHPFQDDRVYLSIAPKDFVVLRQEYQKMVHNSFLLHGYYNYKHLILGKIMEKDRWCYYLGVPGNFYNREKMVAEMFGFEAFEGGRNPARPGDFGYFMKKVEI